MESEEICYQLVRENIILKKAVLSGLEWKNVIKAYPELNHIEYEGLFENLCMSRVFDENRLARIIANKNGELVLQVQAGAGSIYYKIYPTKVDERDLRGFESYTEDFKLPERRWGI